MQPSNMGVSTSVTCRTRTDGDGLVDDAGAESVLEVRGRVAASSAHLPARAARHQRLRSELARQYVPAPRLHPTSRRTAPGTPHPHRQVHATPSPSSRHHLSYL